MTQEPHHLQGNDVVRISILSHFVVPYTTYLADDFVKLLGEQCDRINYSSNQATREKWFISGMDCEVLKPNQNWQKGKVRIGLVFIPDVEEEEEPSIDEETEEVTAEASPLDEIRKMAKDGS